MDRKIPVAVQVYGLRDLLEEHPENFRNVMQKIKDYGYDGVELAGLYGLKPAEVRDILKEVGLVPISAHVPFADMVEDLESMMTRISAAEGVLKFEVQAA